MGEVVGGRGPASEDRGEDSESHRATELLHQAWQHGKEERGRNGGLGGSSLTCNENAAASAWGGVLRQEGARGTPPHIQKGL